MEHLKFKRAETKNNAQLVRPGLTFKAIISFVVTRWYWFVISLFITLVGAFVYLNKTTPLYTRSASLLIKIDEKGKSSNTSVDMTKLGLVQNNSKLDNEVRIVKSPTLMAEVVSRLDLNNTYTIRQGLRNVQLYRQSPVLFAKADTTQSRPISFDFKLKEDSSIVLSKIHVAGSSLGEDIVTHFGDSINLNGTKFMVLNPRQGQEYIGSTIHFNHSSVKSTANALRGSLVAVLPKDKSTIIDISISTPSIQEADDILLTLIQVYNERWLRENNMIAVSTSQFISDRLGIIEKELGNVDSDISSYKSEHLLPDVGAATMMYMNQSAEAQSVLINLTNQLSIAEMVRNQLKGEALSQPLPINTGLLSTDIEAAIAQYNNIVIERNRLLESTSEVNPVVKDRTQALRTLKGNIMASVNAYIATLHAQMNNARQQASSTTSKIAANPVQAKYLLSVERQQKVKESLYLFLLQKREENELSQAFTAYNTSLIEEPHGSSAPTFPNRRNVWMLALVAGLGIPMLIFVGREYLDTKVRGKNDLASLSIPFLGEIPQNAPRRRGLDRFKKQQPDKRKIVVTDGSRDVINEAFRVLRTALDFVGTTDSPCKVITVTSANPGSGKTFTSINLAKSIALNGKRVLLLELDLRKGPIAKVLNHRGAGITEYLIGKAPLDTILLRGIDNTPTLDAITMGVVPPNPSELLSSKKLDQLLDTLRTRYDIIIIDCPPVEVVTDTRIINRLADMTIFVVRSGLLERDELANIQAYYDEDRYHNMGILLNGTDLNSGYSYSRYGYSYGYASTYGAYGYSHKSK